MSAPDPDWHRIRLFPWGEGWCAYESPSVCPCYREREHALSYAMQRARQRPREILVYDSAGELVERLPAPELVDWPAAV